MTIGRGLTGTFSWIAPAGIPGFIAARLLGHNSARSQMAEGLLRKMSGDRFEVFSSGTEQTRVQPLAIEAMREIGIDITGHRSKTLDQFAGENFD